MDKNQIHPSATLILADMGLKRSLEGGNSAGSSPDGSTEVCANHQCNPRRYYEFFLLLLLFPITKPTHQGQVLGVPQFIRSQAGGKEPQIDFRLKKTKRKKKP